LVLTDEQLKAKRKAYSQRPEVKARRKEHDQTEDVKARRRTPEFHSKRNKYLSRPEVKAKAKEKNDKPEVKAKMRAYSQRPENIAREKTRRNRPDVKARYKSITDDTRLKVLQYYSKLHSNSNIPCCRCCGLNSTITFLALDHIAGKKQMDSEPKLVKLGYSSKFQGSTLWLWIKRNNFPEGFQVLCHNCNTAKGLKDNNNKCPMENKPH
jgi:hypothetical protein